MSFFHRFKVPLFLLLVASCALTFVLVLNTIVSGQLRHSWDYADPSRYTRNWELDKEGDETRGLRLARALTFRTISWDHNHQELEEFLKFHDYLRESFPLLHSSPFVKLNIINRYSLLYKIEGSRGELDLPFMMAAHLDVVPVNGTWTADPFDGKIVDGVIYGRGALDDKSSVLGILEAVEFLLKNGYQFQRTFYVAFGHDEELTGFNGAGEICKYLKEKGVNQLDFILDEGFFVLEDIVKGVDHPVSVIGVTEKGYLTLELSVERNPGHSSIPPKETAIGILARAVSRLEETSHPSMFGQGPEWDFFSYISPYAGTGYRFIFSNLWLFSPLMKAIMSQDSAIDAVQRTVTAVTIFHGGYKSNVIPGSATAVVNHRIHPAETMETVVERDRQIIADPRVQIKVRSYQPPTPTSPYGPGAPAFKLIAETVKEIYPTSVVAPACSPANTDLRRYVDLTTNLYRIHPTILTPQTQGGIHGNDERISIDQYHNSVQFYVKLIVNADDEASASSQTDRSHHEL